MKTILTKSLLMLSAGTLLASCMGQSSDPMEKYSALRSGEPTTEQSETQKYVPPVFTSAVVPVGSEFADLKLQGTNEVNNANFLEGKEGVLYFKLSTKSPKITKFKIDIADFPINSRPGLIPTQYPNVHGLRWTPPMGIIPKGQPSILFKLKLQATVLETTDANLRGMMQESLIDVVVARDNTVPVILGKSSLAAGVDEGAPAIKYTIDVEDKASAISPRIPEVRIGRYIYSNTEAFRVDGSNYLRLMDTTRVGSSKTVWRFHFDLKIDELPLDRDRRGIENPQSPAVDVCFHVVVDSVIGTQSVQEQVCFKARYAAQPPTIQWEDETLTEIKAGAPTTIKFKVATGNGLGQVAIKNMAAQISKLTGKKDLICSPESASNLSLQLCELTWSPKCVNAPMTKKLSLKVDAATGKKVKSEIFTRDFVIVPDETNCPAPVPKATTKPVTAKTVKSTAKPSTKIGAAQ